MLATVASAATHTSGALSPGEIAMILGVSKSTVAESLRRAVHKLKAYSDV